MPTTDSAAATIVKRCNEVMGLHRRIEDNMQPWDDCDACPSTWPCATYDLARDLRDAVKAGTKLTAGIDNWMSGNPVPSRMDALGQTLKALDTYRETITTIAERGEGRE